MNKHQPLPDIEEDPPSSGPILFVVAGSIVIGMMLALVQWFAPTFF